jgi:hypothetical protein
MNYTETMYDEAVSYLETVLHSERYYTKTQSDATFFSLAYMGVDIGPDADLVDGLHALDMISDALPAGAILIWSGTDGNVPSGYHICDGGTYNGYATPDLRGRFVVSAGTEFEAGDTGGSISVTLTGTVTIGNTTLTTAMIPAHYHTLYDIYCDSTTMGQVETYGTRYNGTTSAYHATDNAGGGQPHNHSTKAVSFVAFDPRPEYTSRYYIMKVT